MNGRLNDCCTRCEACERTYCRDNPNDISPGEGDGVCADCWRDDGDAA